MSKIVEARMRIKGKQFEVLVDVDKALQMRRGIPVSIDNVLSVEEIFYDSKKGLRAGKDDLISCFGTDNIKEIAKKIIMQGDIQIPLEYKHKMTEEKMKQIVDFFSRNAIDPTTGNPHTPNRIREAIERSGIKIDNRSIEEQIPKILEEIQKILPIKIKTKKLKLIIPSIYTGHVYGLLKNYKEKEEWLENGDLVVIINLPAGLQMEFYDKINSLTHGSIITEEVKSNE